MRTTVDLADDVAAAVARIRRERGLGLSAAVNELIRAGMSEPSTTYVYRPVTKDLGARVDLTNIGDVLDLLDDEGPRRRVAVLVDANVLLYAVDSSSPHHAQSASWLRSALEGDRRIGIPWQTIGAFLRIATHPRVFREPFTAAEAWQIVEQWLSAPVSWIPEATTRTARILGRLVTGHGITGNLVTDAQLAALAVEHGVPVVSADTDFARFPDVTWINPTAPE